jgi:hypothetical protein
MEDRPNRHSQTHGHKKRTNQTSSQHEQTQIIITNTHRKIEIKVKVETVQYGNDEYEYANDEYEYANDEYEYANDEYEYANDEYEYVIIRNSKKCLPNFRRLMIFV